jgi:hypothetical protein
MTALANPLTFIASDAAVVFWLLFHHEKVTRPLAAKSGKRQLQHNYALENLIKK